MSLTEKPHLSLQVSYSVTTPTTSSICLVCVAFIVFCGLLSLRYTVIFLHFVCVAFIMFCGLLSLRYTVTIFLHFVCVAFIVFCGLLSLRYTVIFLHSFTSVNIIYCRCLICGALISFVCLLSICLVVFWLCL